MRLLLTLFLLLTATAPSFAQQRETERALADAVALFESAVPSLGAAPFGVDVVTYRDALVSQQFSSAFWGGSVSLAIATQEEASGDCARFAAYTAIPPRDGVVTLVLCPEFFTPGSDTLRRLTVLHEMVHVVAGRDECRAMAFAAAVEEIATGAYTPVDRYWQANGCPRSEFSLP